MNPQMAWNRVPSIFLLTAFSAACGSGNEAQYTEEQLPMDDVTDTVVGADAVRVGALEAGSELDSDAKLAPVAAPGQGRDVSGLTLASTRTETTLPARGDNGGSYVGHVGQGVIWALKTFTFEYVNGLRVYYYMPSNPDNDFRNGDSQGSLAYGDTVSGPGVFGAFNRASMLECPDGQGVIGIRGAAGSFLDSIGIVCGDVDHPDPYSSKNYLSPIAGGGGGSFFDDRCPAGYLVTGFNLRHGSYIDQIQPICIAAHDFMLPAATVLDPLKALRGG